MGMSNCRGYNPDTHSQHYPGGVCFIFYSGTWDGGTWQNAGCHNTGNDFMLLGTDSTEGGTCYKKESHVNKKSGPTSTTATTTAGPTTTGDATTAAAAAAAVTS